MNIKHLRVLEIINRRLFNVFSSTSYSQTGEDTIINFFREAKKMKSFKYLDIGANHPTKLNNTYFFYEKGFSGVSIEPNPGLASLHQKIRKRDTILQCGVGFGTNGHLSDYYVMSDDVLNTFSKEEADRMQREGLSTIKDVIKVKTIPLSEILMQHFAGAAPDFLNLDVEGLDLAILRSWDFEKVRPSLICLETVEFTSDASSKKNTEIIDLMSAKHYHVFADTYVNTIFYDSYKF